MKFKFLCVLDPTEARIYGIEFDKESHENDFDEILFAS